MKPARRVARPPHHLVLVCLGLLPLWACVPADDGLPPLEHDEPADLVPAPEDTGKGDGVPSSFDRNRLMDEAFFDNGADVTTAEVQRFLEHTPYGIRSFLADEETGGQSVAAALTQAAREHSVNPIVLLARIQSEKSLVSKSSRPSQHTIDYALGCGCPDGGSCSSAYRGLGRQIACGAKTLRARHDDSADGSGEWRVGKTKKTLDHVSITPANDATASHYAYTPWCLQGSGGTWLIWNVLRKFVLHFEAQGSSVGGGGNAPTPWVGTVCDTDGDCAFTAAGKTGFCHTYSMSGDVTGGYCTVKCEGTCPDRSESAPTFCAADGAGGGRCVVKADVLNDTCHDIPGTLATEADRFVGESGSAAATAIVCLEPR